jgi:16S rRNA (guanine966-N2)-methyltransferase
LKNFISVVLEFASGAPGAGAGDSDYPNPLAQGEEMARKGPGRQADIKPSHLRIIGGQWRGRKLAFHAAPGLRPTTDRIRETLFNWLAPFLHDARCADLFAGSGALGLEALSRGAGYCDFVDTNPSALTDIGEHLSLLSAGDRGRCTSAAAGDFIARTNEPYDIVFVDPPFAADLAGGTLALLASCERLTPGGLVYLETAKDQPEPPLPDGWAVFREKQSGGVSYRLLAVSRPA